jgi:hypothetical protein
MKHQVIAVLVGSLFALPALAGEQNAQQVNEWEYPALVATSSFSRAEVLAQLTEARSTGDFVANAETGDKAYQLYPSVYPARAVAAGRSAGRADRRGTRRQSHRERGDWHPDEGPLSAGPDGSRRRKRRREPVLRSGTNHRGTRPIHARGSAFEGREPRPVVSARKAGRTTLTPAASCAAAR